MLRFPAARDVRLVVEPEHEEAWSCTMRWDGDGLWSRTKMLPVGRYVYDFIVDGVNRSVREDDRTEPRRFKTSRRELVVYRRWTREV